MFSEKLNAVEACDATVVRGAGHVEKMGINGYYTVECRDSEGNLKWTDGFSNLVTTVGQNSIITAYLNNTTAGAVVMGLMGTGTPNVSDTQASHSGWLEVGGANAPTYSGTRKTPVFGTAAAGTITTSTAVVFAITSSGTVAGCFINIGGSSAIDSTTGTLFSAGDFTAGSKTVSNGDTLSVTYSLTA
jgi:hypothetical protein